MALGDAAPCRSPDLRSGWRQAELQRAFHGPDLAVARPQAGVNLIAARVHDLRAAPRRWAWKKQYGSTSLKEVDRCRRRRDACLGNDRLWIPHCSGTRFYSRLVLLRRTVRTFPTASF